LSKSAGEQNSETGPQGRFRYFVIKIISLSTLIFAEAFVIVFSLIRQNLLIRKLQ